MSHFVICINNKSNRASLIMGKVYRTLPDPDAEVYNLLRIIDEDRLEPDGYLYPKTMFAPIELPEAVEQALPQQFSLSAIQRGHPYWYGLRLKRRMKREV
jgi:hypothetical protein